MIETMIVHKQCSNMLCHTVLIAEGIARGLYTISLQTHRKAGKQAHRDRQQFAETDTDRQMDRQTDSPAHNRAYSQHTYVNLLLVFHPPQSQCCSSMHTLQAGTQRLTNTQPDRQTDRHATMHTVSTLMSSFCWFLPLLKVIAAAQ